MQFADEEGIDAGGLTREWFTMVFKDALDPNKGLFKLSANQITL